MHALEKWPGTPAQQKTIFGIFARLSAAGPLAPHVQ